MFHKQFAASVIVVRVSFMLVGLLVLFVFVYFLIRI